MDRPALGAAFESALTSFFTDFRSERRDSMDDWEHMLFRADKLPAINVKVVTFEAILVPNTNATVGFRLDDTARIARRRRGSFVGWFGHAGVSVPESQLAPADWAP